MYGRKYAGLAAQWVKRQGVAFAAVVVTFAVGSRAFATDPPPLTLPETGVDVPEIIELAVASMGAVAGAALLGFVAFLVVKKSLGWIRRAV